MREKFIDLVIGISFFCIEWAILFLLTSEHKMKAAD
jgi:hypothetical protein